MGAASASNGAVGLFHVENITPEVLEKGKKLLKEEHKTYVIDEAELKRVFNSYPLMWKNKLSKPKFCFIGCPHLSLSQLYSWTEIICSGLKARGKERVSIRTILCAAPDVIQQFKEDTRAYTNLLKTGAKLTSICPLMYMNNPICSKEPVITNSNKLRTYTTARFYTDEEILSKIVDGN